MWVVCSYNNVDSCISPFLCFRLTVLSSISPFVFSFSWLKRPAVKVNDLESCYAFRSYFQLCQNSCTLKWFDTLFNSVSAKAFSGIIKVNLSTNAAWGLSESKRIWQLIWNYVSLIESVILVTVVGNFQVDKSGVRIQWNFASVGFKEHVKVVLQLLVTPFLFMRSEERPLH